MTERELKRQLLNQAILLQEQELTIANQQAEILRLKSRIVADRRKKACRKSSPVRKPEEKKRAKHHA